MLSFPARNAAASSRIETETATEIAFPQGMTFRTRISLPSPDKEIDAVQLLYRIGSDPTLNLEIVSPSEFTTDGQELQIDTFVDFLASFVPFGVPLTYSWEIMLTDGEVLETVEESTYWMDNRFNWEERTSDQVTLFTYGVDDEFADRMLAESQGTIDELESRYELDAVQPTTIWIYPSYGDFKGTMQGNSREAIAGLTYPGLDTIVAIVPNGNSDEFGRVIPHEISHQVLFAATDNAYGAPPLWFDEGIATHTQIGGTENYSQMVANANADGTLFDIASLETSFPFQPAQATLAYASSWSMITYIEVRWGPEGISALIDAFASGLPTDVAIQSALGITLEELDLAWKAWISLEGSVHRISS
jgi:hypothetical protein